MPATLTAVVTFIWIALTALLLGGAVLRVSRSYDFGSGQRVIIAWAVGLPLLAYATLTLGLLGGLNESNLALLLLIAGGVGLAAGARELVHLLALFQRAGRALLHSRYRVVYWFLLLWGCSVLLAALLPPAGMDWDGLAEHLAMAKVWLHEGAIVPLWYDHHSQFPATVQMLYLLGLAFGGPVAAKLVHMLFGLLSLAVVALLTRHHFDRPSAPLALVIFAATPLVGWLAAVAYVDLGAVFYLVLGLHFFLDWLTHRRLALALWSGVCLGLAMAVKMQAIVFFAVLVLMSLYLLWRRRMTAHRLPARQVLALVGIAVVTASPWYVKSWLLTGNPVYPFAYSIFGGKQWSEWQARTYAYEQKSWGWGELPREEEFWQMPAYQRAFAGPRRPDRLLLAPVGLTFLPWKYVDPGFGKLAAIMFTSIGPLYLAFLPLLLLVRRPWGWRVIAWLLVPVGLWWLASAHYSRYLLPALAWLAAPAGYAAYHTARRSRWLKHMVVAALGLMLILSICFNLLHGLGGLPVLLGQESVEQYLDRALPPYRVLQLLNQRMGPADKLIAYGEPRLFYLDRPYLWGDPNYHQLIVYDRMKTADDLLAAYRREGITHVLINAQFFPGPRPRNRHLVSLIQEAVAQGKMGELAGSRGPYRILQVRGEAGQS